MKPTEIKSLAPNGHPWHKPAWPALFLRDTSRCWEDLATGVFPVEYIPQTIGASRAAKAIGGVKSDADAEHAAQWLKNHPEVNAEQKLVSEVGKVDLEWVNRMMQYNPQALKGGFYFRQAIGGIKPLPLP